MISQKKAFLYSDAEKDSFESLIRVPPSDYKPHAVMQRLHGSLARTRINRGGLGSGKTRGMGEHLYALGLAYPGARILIGRKDLTSLKETTQKEFLEKVVRPETVADFNVNDNKLYLKNASEFLFRETKEPDKVKSLELTAYGLDETDENDTPEIWEKIDDRLRQKIWMNGSWVTPPYAGILTFNPTPEEHWLCELSKRTDISVEDFQSSTYDNIDNLPTDYIPNLLKKLPPWDVRRLIHGHWGRQIKGKPVYHGFSYENNVRTLKVNEAWPLFRCWDFGFNHPAVRWAQLDPITGRGFLLREFLGHQQYLNAPTKDRPSVIEEVKRITGELVGVGYPIQDFCDPHGADKKDNAESSVETLRIHFGIHCTYQRSRIDKGMDEIQYKIITKDRLSLEDEKQESLWLVDHSCKVTIDLYSGGYHRDEMGLPNKDGFYDHLADVDRYWVVNTMNRSLSHRHRKFAKQYQPRNLYTGY